MALKYSVSATHGGQKDVSVAHNMRYNAYIKQAHIDENGVHETWIHEDLKQVYKDLFDEAKEEYNRQKVEKGKAYQQIKDYQRHCRDSKQTNEVYEVIFTIGNVDNHPDVETCRDVLKDVVDGFIKMNPSFKVTGAYYHADEPGAAPHVHLDYIPVSRENSRGLSVQNNLTGALKAQGFVTKHRKDTAQMRWQNEVRDMVEAVSRRHGLDIERGVSKNAKHIDTELFKKQTELRDLNGQRLGEEQKLYLKQKELRELSLEVGELERDRNKLTNRVAQLKDEVEEMTEEHGSVGAILNENERLKKENSRLKRVLEVFQKAFNVVETYLKGKTIRFKDSQEPINSWERMKMKLFDGLGKKEYDEFQRNRHEDTIKEKPAIIFHDER